MATQKFVSSLDMDSSEVSCILHKKIAEEREKVLLNETDESKAYEDKLFSNVKYDKNKINVLSLFSGAGGLDLGMELSAVCQYFGEDAFSKSYADKDTFKEYADKIINVVYSNDNFKAANISYRNNLLFDGIQDTRDVRQVTKFPKCDLMLGGFPCPGFSAAGPRLLDDPRNFLYIHYIRALMDSKPKIFITYPKKYRIRYYPKCSMTAQA